jgi:putative MFS transporter
LVKPEASVTALIPAFLYLAAFFTMSGIVYGFFGIETKGRSFEAIEEQLEGKRKAVSDAAKATSGGQGS